MAYSGPSSLALVLSGGGARGAYQAGVIRAIAERAPAEFRFPLITGVSAGAINAAFLASFEGTLTSASEGLCDAWRNLSTDKVFRGDRASLLRSGARWGWMMATGGRGLRQRLNGVVDTEPLRDYLSQIINETGIERNIEGRRLRALALSATHYSTGQTITFVSAAPGIRAWERAGRRGVLSKIGISHVMASSAIPLIFPAVPIDQEYYGDGSVRQSAPLSPAIHLGADRLLAISVRYTRSREEENEPQFHGYPPPAQILGMLMNSIFLDSLDCDAERLQRVNRTLDHLGPHARHPEGLVRIRLLILNPSRDLGRLSADYCGHLPDALRYVVRGLGAGRSSVPDFLSYLLFEKAFIDRLIELGYEDTCSRWDQIDEFLSSNERPDRELQELTV